MADLARARLVLSSARRGRIGWLVGVALLAALGGAGASHAYWHARMDAAQQRTAAFDDAQELRRALEQSRLLQRVSDARSHELERQIELLNQKLRECQEELTFFRQARDARH
jgi:predicted ribosomally synthesized peptide with SipW-like signal peptide